MPLKWYGNEAMIYLRTQAGDRLDRATDAMVNHARREMSIPNTRMVQSSKTKSGLIAVPNTKGAEPSKPGEYPRKGWGHLRIHVVKEMSADRMRARIGTNVIYGKWLELGTRFMKRRPWLSRTLSETYDRVRRIMMGGR
jgi:hypothetical protein